MPYHSVALYPLSSPNHNVSRYVLVKVNVALYPLSSPNHNKCVFLCSLKQLRYILFHHQTTTGRYYGYSHLLLRYILFHHQTTTPSARVYMCTLLRYILFHHQTTTSNAVYRLAFCCVISSFITKPQPCPGS